MTKDAKRQKKKVLYVITKSNFGGAQRYVYDLATNLPRAQYDVSVAAGGSGELIARLNEHHIPVITIERLGRDIRLLNEIVVFLKLVALFRRTRPDVVHLNSSKIGGLGALAARIYNMLPKGNPLKAESYKLKAKIIFTAHGWAFNEPRSHSSRMLLRLIQWITVMLAHKTIAVSHHTRRQMKDLPLTKKKIVVIHNGMTPPNFFEKKEARRIFAETWGLKLDTRIVWIGIVAELHRNKGLEHAIEAFSILIHKHKERAALVIVGEGEERGRLARLIADRSLAKHVVLVGHVPDAARYLKAFDIFLVPSVKEGFPYTLLEAGCASVPVAASDIGGIPEAVDDMESGVLVRPADAGELEKAVLFLLREPESGIGLARRLHERITNDFSVSAMIEKTVKLYRALF